MTHCWRRNYYVTLTGRAINATVGCPEYYQWTVSEYCCGYDRINPRPYCCHSETYKLLVAVGLFCATILGSACLLFLCWYSNFVHHFLRLITCGHFNLNEFVQKSKLNGPYVDPSFYAGEPFWTPGGSELQPYPLRPMPPRIFYPSIPGKGMGRWAGSNTRLPHGQMPLFVLASRQFTRKPYSARPSDRGSASSSFSGPSNGWEGTNSRRGSSTSNQLLDPHHLGRGPGQPSFSFRVHIDEVEAAAELLEALKNMDEKGDKAFSIPKLQEETQRDLDLENEAMDADIVERQKDKYTEISIESEAVVGDHRLHPPRIGSGQGHNSLSNKRQQLLNYAGSLDSASSSYALESILEEKYQNGPTVTYPSSDEESLPYNTPESIIPGYIPDAAEPQAVPAK